MLNWRVPPSLLHAYVPSGTELDEWQGHAFVSIVGFLFLNTRVLGVPIPWHRNFEELNLRFYVRRTVGGEARRAVTFIKELVPRRAIATVARLAYNEPYEAVPMRHRIDHQAASSTTPDLIVRPWLAALLSFVPGLGHAYAGDRNRAIGVFGVDLVLALLLIVALVFAPGGAVGLGLPFALYIAWRVWIVVDAWRAARHPHGAWAELPRRRGTLVLLGFFVVAVLVGELTSRVVKAKFAEAFRIPSGSMEPTILVGDLLFATTSGLFPLEHGRIIVYRSVDVDGEVRMFVRRLVGLPNDTLAMVNGTLIRNGQRIVEPYAVTDTILPDPEMGEDGRELQSMGSADDPARVNPTTRNWGPLVVPPEHVFILGDNRDNSRDSRYVGFIPVSHVKKRALRLYWSRDPVTGAIRWERVGKYLK